MVIITNIISITIIILLRSKQKIIILKQIGMKSSMIRNIFTLKIIKDIVKYMKKPADCREIFFIPLQPAGFMLTDGTGQCTDFFNLTGYRIAWFQEIWRFKTHTYASWRTGGNDSAGFQGHPLG